MTAHIQRKHRTAPQIIIIVLASITAAAGAALALIFIVGGVFAPATYLEPWEQQYAERFDDPRMQLVAQALLAPSSHNEQPWAVELDDTDADVLYLYADAARLTPEVDPLARQTMISQGTFLTYLRVAGEKAGIDVAIELFPDGLYDETDIVKSMAQRPVARATLTHDSSLTPGDSASLFRSDTNRSAYSSVAVTAAQASELEGLSASEHGLLVYRAATDVAAIGDATVRGTIIESENTAVAAESAGVFRSNEDSKNDSRSGFAVEGQGTTGFMKYFLQGVTTLLPATNNPASAAARDVALATDGAAHTPAYVLLQTPGNTRAEQVEAGILYASMALRARSLGLVVQPVSQILEEYPTMSGERLAIHDAYASNGGTIQMIARLGTATVDYPPTMRRDASDLLIDQR